ncbi:MAG TPA: beta-propeller fold lactonase family protein [Luteibacter sp.]|uniref:lactonase family protein n=1 Tax=Luteibacter sp. TaxID=1886636 RepID=UPI002B97CB72|nr:beta-propeller fold lactonase family protein [Luteibacter sp.]HVI55919.1 beta-propeller fold lactonase family protein [Luteibacter sp.]
MNMSRKLAIAIVGALATVGAVHAQDRLSGLHGFDSPFVYVMSNDIQSNSVAVLRRNFFGGLEKVSVASTEGKGVGVGTTAPRPDPLGSQNALLKSANGRLLFATNAGSNQISVFAIEGSRLRLIDIQPTGGTYPVSVAQRGNRLYVLNSAATSTVTAFQITAGGQLVALPAETRLLGTDAPLVGNQPNVGMTPAQLQVSPDGNWLAVSIKDASAKGWFELFTLGHDGGLGKDPAITPSNDPQPFGFDFDNHGHLIATQAAGSAASSYAIGRDGILEAISSDVPNGQAAACWLAVSGRFAFTANAGKGNISGYRVGNDGSLTVLDGGIAGTLEAGAAPTDLKASADGLFLYVGNSLGGDVDTFLILGDGRLLQVGQTPVFAGASGMQGLAL